MLARYFHPLQLIAVVLFSCATTLAIVDFVEKLQVSFSLKALAFCCVAAAGLCTSVYSFFRKEG